MMFEFHIDLRNTVTGIRLGYTPMCTTGYLMPRRVGLIDSDNLCPVVKRNTDRRYRKAQKQYGGIRQGV